MLACIVYRCRFVIIGVQHIDLISAYLESIHCLDVVGIDVASYRLFCMFHMAYRSLAYASNVMDCPGIVCFATWNFQYMDFLLLYCQSCCVQGWVLLTVRILKSSPKTPHYPGNPPGRLV